MSRLALYGVCVVELVCALFIYCRAVAQMETLVVALQRSLFSFVNHNLCEMLVNLVQDAFTPLST